MTKYIIRLVKSNGLVCYWTENPRVENNIVPKRSMGPTEYCNFGDACQVLGELPLWHQNEFRSFMIIRVVS